MWRALSLGLSIIRRKEMLGQWNPNTKKHEIEVTTEELTTICNGLGTSGFIRTAPEITLYNDLIDELQFGEHESKSGTVKTQEVVANPYARHVMKWDQLGGGLCVHPTARPNKKYDTCGEPIQSPIHGNNDSDKGYFDRES
jgi:hypothetical protein